MMKSVTAFTPSSRSTSGLALRGSMRVRATPTRIAVKITASISLSINALSGFFGTMFTKV